MIQRRGAVHLDAPASESEVPIQPDRAVLELVPEAVARENHIVPLRFDRNDRLLIATTDPDNIALADKLSFILNKPIRLVAYPHMDIRRAIYRYYGGHARTESVDSMLAEFTDTAISFSVPAAHAKSVGKTLVEFRAPRHREADESEEFELAHSDSGEDHTPGYGSSSMWYYTVDDGQRALAIHKDGRMEVVVGPRRVLLWGKRFERMRHFVAHPGEFLLIRFRDGRQEHLAGPCDVWFDPRIHEQISRQESLQLAAKEAVIVYSRDQDSVSRRIVYGPSLFVPAPGEWLHTFTWHGSDGGSKGERKVAKGLVFQKLWLMPDQMYHDVTDVRTVDDAVLTIKLMVFFELLDIDRMLEATHDPIGDFINAATSDVVDFTGRRTFEQFKTETGMLNELDAYRQLTARAAQNGYRVNKVVYRATGHRSGSRPCTIRPSNPAPNCNSNGRPRSRPRHSKTSS